MIQVSANAVEQLASSKLTLEDYQKRLKENDKEKHESLIEQCKDASKEITSLMDLFLGKEDKRQGIVRNPESTVMTRIGSARRYVVSRPDGITSTEEVLIEHATNEVNAALEKVNAFYAKQWPDLKDIIEAVELSGFQPTTVFSLEN